jgi:hypothetical protein
MHRIVDHVNLTLWIMQASHCGSCKSIIVGHLSYHVDHVIQSLWIMYPIIVNHVNLAL